MKTILLLGAAGLAALAVPAIAQNVLLLPASASPTSELPNYGLYPFAYTNARVQMFFDATEVGASSFTATEISFRYDGPLPQVGAPGPFTIQRLQIRIGATTVGLPDARFNANLAAPLTTAFDSQVIYYPDPGVAALHPWGAPNGSLTFTFLAPVAVSIPPGGWFVVEIAMDNNNFSMFGFAHTMIDAASTPGGPVDGQSVTFGSGCSIAGATPPATIGITGLRAPGAAHFVTGQNLGTNAAVMVLYGLDNTQSVFGPLPLRMPGTNCDLLVSADVTSLTFADGSGNLTAGLSNALSVPPDPVLAGFVLHEQLAALSPGANAFQIAFSNAQTVTLGSLSRPGRGTYLVGNSQSAIAPLATHVLPLGTAVRLTTL
jgi:hypothetical protein